MPKKRTVSILLMVLMLTALLAGCAKSGGSGAGSTASGLTKDSVYKLYNMTQLNKTKQEIDNTLKVKGSEESEVKNSITYTDPATGFGVYVTYNDSNVSTSKTLVYPEARDLAFLFAKQVTEKQADDLTKGMDYAAVKSALGEEGAERGISEVKNSGLTSMYYWVNQDGSLIQAVFGPDGKMIGRAMFIKNSGT